MDLWGWRDGNGRSGGIDSYLDSTVAPGVGGEFLWRRVALRWPPQSVLGGSPRLGGRRAAKRAAGNERDGDEPQAAADIRYEHEGRSGKEAVG
nr:unnamed protein product [Digitaria exilis]